MKKRISLILAVIMVAALFCSVLPLTAGAEEAPAVTTCNVTVDGEDMGSMEIAVALSLVNQNLGDEVVINLTSDWNIDGAVAIDGANLTINGNNHIITVKEGMGNVFIVNGKDKNITINNATITGDAAGPSSASSCIFQIKGDNAGVVLTDVVMNNLKAKWYIINLMGNNGSQKNATLTRVIATNIPTPFLSSGNSNNPEKNVWDHTNYCVIKINDSLLTSEGRVIQINAGSTCDIDVNNSTLQIVDTATKANPVVRVEMPKNLAEGQVNTSTIDITNSVIKFPAAVGCTENKIGNDGDTTGITYNYVPGVPTAAETQAPPATDAPATDAPATDAPATEAPTTEAPAGGCGGIAIAAQLVTLICAAAAVLIIKKK